MRDGTNQAADSVLICDFCGTSAGVWQMANCEVICEACYEARQQAGADRAYDEWRDREMWEANDE